MKTLALKNLTIKDVLFQPERVAFIMEYSDKLDQAQRNYELTKNKLNHWKKYETIGNFHEAEMALIDYLFGIKKATEEI